MAKDYDTDDFFSSFEITEETKADFKKDNKNTIPDVSSVRTEISNVNLMQAALSNNKEQKHDKLNEYLQMPATEGWRGWLVRLGIKMPPNQEEKKRRTSTFEQYEKQVEMRSRLRKEIVGGAVSVFVVFSEKGGAGKSTTSALLAYALSEFGDKSVALAEVNPHRGTLGYKMGIPTDKCLVDLIDDLGDGTMSSIVSTDPREFMPQAEGMSVNVLAGNVARGPQGHTTSAQDVVTVCKSLSRVWPIIVLDNGTDIEDRGKDWSKKSASFGSFALASSLVLVTNSDLAEAKGIVSNTLDFIENNIDDLSMTVNDRAAWRELRNSVVLVIVDKSNGVPTKKMVTEADGELIGSEEAFKVYQYFHPKVRGIVILPYDAALTKTPINFQALQGRTKKAAMKIADLVWSYQPLVT